jgi:hypothetical protein
MIHRPLTYLRFIFCSCFFGIANMMRQGDDCVVLEGKVGGAEEDRTPDLRIANATLSQLSYRPIWVDSIDCRVQTQVVGLQQR